MSNASKLATFRAWPVSDVDAIISMELKGEEISGVLLPPGFHSYGLLYSRHFLNGQIT